MTSFVQWPDFAKTFACDDFKGIKNSLRTTVVNGAYPWAGISGLLRGQSRVHTRSQESTNTACGTKGSG